MAIDTALKRFSILLDPGSMPPPDGTLAAADRLFMLEFYSGIAAVDLKTGPVIVAALGSYQMGPRAIGSYQAGPAAMGNYQFGPVAMGGASQ